MRQAINNIKGKFPADSYDFIHYNCQDFVEAARQEYNKIKGEKYA